MRVKYVKGIEKYVAVYRRIKYYVKFPKEKQENNVATLNSKKEKRMANEASLGKLRPT
jgi:hypothetical protein